MTSKASSRKLWWRDKKIAPESILLVLVISFRQAWAIKRFIVSPRIVGPTHLIDAIFFKTVTFSSRGAPVVAPHMSHRSSGWSSGWCVDIMRFSRLSSHHVTNHAFVYFFLLNWRNGNNLIGLYSNLKHRKGMWNRHIFKFGSIITSFPTLPWAT